ncbi:molybdenum ABC transporter [Halorhodospira halochloris]|uniref:Molybdenum ABC transporter n=1 Tax=Halorhodospira halochloris TaxID=1052 RepID=A0A0X8X6E8_HALHR|nr:molybdate ABC transporter substrate-binding protein [Halorhodospira halochloris]MBK1652490.1 molybdate ABC transporter substrate-binding protein [Halorhodospira halochloris]BAU56386.1 molybdenum ABC transporter [Halorhodospira halochloris]
MKNTAQLTTITALCCTILLTPLVAAAELRVASAANFLSTIKELAAQYEDQTGQQIRISSGSSGALYAQISNGAPFDLFFSADVKRAEALVDDGMAYADSRFTYALGIPILWSDREDWLEDPQETLRAGDFRFITIAEPRNAPYGAAAKQILSDLDLWQRFTQEGRIIRAQNLTQAYSHVASGAADLGFLALSQLKDKEGEIPGSFWRPPAELFSPIEQQAVILKRAEDHNAAREFTDWLRGDEARDMIEQAGYAIP